MLAIYLEINTKTPHVCYTPAQDLMPPPSKRGNTGGNGGVMRIALITDAWTPQINGVVTTLKSLAGELETLGHEVLIIHPGLFATVPCPTYREIRLAAAPLPGVARRLKRFQPEAVHIATEGSVGLAGWLYCRLRGWRFTTSFHTRFPEYVNTRWPWIPVALGYHALRLFHHGGVRTMVSTTSMGDFLRNQGFSRLVLWRRGVDTTLFKPVTPVSLALPRPVFMYFGRVAPEKNVEAFLALDLPGSKLIAGDGPARATLERRYPDAYFAGIHRGADLVRYICVADCMVFPSRTDTLGMVLMEALACGVPVAAFPVTGPQQVVEDGVTGILSDDLRAAALAAVELDPRPGIHFARAHSWNASAMQFASRLEAVQPAKHSFDHPARDISRGAY